MTNGLITFLASFLIWVMFVGLLALWIIDGRIKKEQALHALTAAALSWLLSSFIKYLVPTPRPFYLNGKDPLTLTIPNDGSFPSIHEAIAFSLAITLLLHDKRLGIAFIVVALIIGAARVAGNVHTPTDILGGAILGSLVALFTERFHFGMLLFRKRSRHR